MDKVVPQVKIPKPINEQGKGKEQSHERILEAVKGKNELIKGVVKK